MRLSFRCVVRNGIRRFQIADPSNDPVRLRRLARMAREEGVEEVVIGLTYSVSEVHTHAYYAERAEALADCAEMDRLYLKDPGGLLTPAALHDLAPHFLRAAGDRAVELHSHCTIGLAPLVYVEGLRAGFRVLHTAVAPLARGTSNPAAETTLRDLEAEGYSHRLDHRCARRDVGALPRAGREKGLPVGAPQEFDATYYHHQLAGGMVSTTRRMLEEQRRPELFDAVLEEVGRVRAEMGYPIIVTPVSQLVATQAVRNVIDGERWANVSVETIRYFLGHYGEPAAPVAADVAERVLSRAARRGASQARAGASRGSPRTLRARDLRRGAAAAADHARGAGGRDTRVSPAFGPARGRTAATRWRRSCGRSRSASRSHIFACRRGTTWWSGAVRLDDVRGFVFDVDGTLVHRAGNELHVQPGAAEVLARIRASGRPFAIFTNGTHEPPEAFAAGLRSVGLDVADDELLTPLAQRPRPTCTRTASTAACSCSAPRPRASTSSALGCRSSTARAPVPSSSRTPTRSTSTSSSARRGRCSAARSC